MVVAHKEHRLLALRDPLGALLARAAAASRRPRTRAAGAGPVAPRERAARGHDPTYALTARAAALLRAAGQDVGARRLLHPRPGVVDQAGLGAAERAANLAGSMCCPTAALRRLAARHPGPRSSCATTCSPPGPPRARPSGRSRRSVCTWPGSPPWPPRAGDLRPTGRLGTAHFRTPRFRPAERPTSVGPWSPSGSVVASSRHPGPGRPGGKPMPVAGETVHVRLVRPEPRSGAADHGAA